MDTNKTKINLISIPPDKQISLVIGGGFYQRLNKLLIEYGDSKGTENLTLAMAKIQTGCSQTNDFAYNLETLIILIRDIENAFKDAGHTVETSIEFEVPQEVIDVVTKHQS